MKAILAALVLGCTLASVSAAPVPASAAATVKLERPAQWAQPISLAGVPNLFKVNDRLYRSAQPSAEGMANLQKLGIKTVINLREFHSDKDKIGSLPLAAERIPMVAWNPEQGEVVRFLQLVNDPARAPILVHCQHGADRTGTMVAIYRVVFDGWSKEAALQEMIQGGYGFHTVWTNLPPWIGKLDIDAVKKQAGISVNQQ